MVNLPDCNTVQSGGYKKHFKVACAFLGCANKQFLIVGEYNIGIYTVPTSMLYGKT